MARNETYEEFVEKFKPKKTTDDCMTPPEIYEVVKDWACGRYQIDPAVIVRPFWPGGDYENYDYPVGCVVIDNPPFSILAKICEFYLSNDIKFFLFAPSLTCLSGKTSMRINHIICDAQIEYENGAKVGTSFVTNLGDGETVMESAPDLSLWINEAVDELHARKTTKLPQYVYPDYVITSARMQYYARHGVALKIKHRDCTFIRSLDAQRKDGKAIFGGGLLLNERAAAERAAAERAAAERAAAERAAAERAAAERAHTIVWELSEREKEIIKGMS